MNHGMLQQNKVSLFDKYLFLFLRLVKLSPVMVQISMSGILRKRASWHHGCHWTHLCATQERSQQLILNNHLHK